jgi:hypothetical protein
VGGAKTLPPPPPPSCADCLEIWEPQPPGTLRAYPGLYLTFTFAYLAFCGLALYLLLTCAILEYFACIDFSLALRFKFQLVAIKEGF